MPSVGGGWGTPHSVVGHLYMVMAMRGDPYGPLKPNPSGFHYHTVVLTLLDAGIAYYHLRSTAWDPPTLWVAGQDPPSSFYRPGGGGPER